MHKIVGSQTYPEKLVPLGQYVSIPSLTCAKDLCDVLDNFSFSCSPISDITNSQCISLHYTEGSILYTLGWYDIHYDVDARTTISHFATANLRGLSSTHMQNSQFASKMHILRTPVPGLGSKLFQHLIVTVTSNNMPVIKVSADASSVPFYTQMSKQFSDFFARVDTNYTRYMDGGCDFTFILK